MQIQEMEMRNLLNETRTKSKSPAGSKSSSSMCCDALLLYTVNLHEAC